MGKIFKIGSIILVIAAIAGACVYLANSNIAVLEPKGIISAQQRDLMVVATLLCLVVVLPVFIMTGYIAYKYRASNHKARYTPNWDGSRLAESVWWGVPLIIIVILAGITWKTSHELDPFRPLASEKKPVTVQVVALEWKWLFIYPEQNIASVNHLQIPEDTPINFEVTADAPMNSFWIPQLGGQIYAMPGMSTKLHLEASEIGDYRGSSANLSGKGFSDMVFTARASSQADFDSWVSGVKSSTQNLDTKTYSELSKPATQPSPSFYASSISGLYQSIEHKFNVPPAHLREHGEGNNSLVLPETHSEGGH